eukprot:scaffold12300_cov132-Isochrysis_galbana.AAC.1
MASATDRVPCKGPGKGVRVCAVSAARRGAQGCTLGPAARGIRLRSIKPLIAHVKERLPELHDAPLRDHDPRPSAVLECVTELGVALQVDLHRVGFVRFRLVAAVPVIK